MLESPQSFVVREECQKATWQNGYRRPLGEHGGWAAFGSTTGKGTVYLAAAGAHGPWYLGLDHHGVIAELGLAALDLPGPGRARFAQALGEQARALLPWKDPLPLTNRHRAYLAWHRSKEFIGSRVHPVPESVISSNTLG